MDRALLQAYATGLAVRGLVALPEPVMRALAGPVPEVARGLEAEAWFLARLSGQAEKLAARRPIPPLDEQRAIAEAQSHFLSRTSRRPVPSTDGTAGGVPVRTYTPAGAHGTLVFFHGGGWVQRSVASHDRAVRHLAELAQVNVVSVDYRRAPEHPFPAAADDAFVAYRSICEHLGDDKVAVGGDSAGGNLAASVAITARDRGDRVPDFQWLLYPATDAAFRHPSAKAFSTGFFLTEAAMDKYTDLYLPDKGTHTDPRASPIYADPTGLPPAYVATALADPLRDEGEAYAARLREGGVHAVTQRFAHLHGFFNATTMRRAREMVAVTAGALRAGLA